jgi:hypothetical protein
MTSAWPLLLQLPFVPAKLHHYVPQVTLRRFAVPTENDLIWRLDKETGECRRGNVKNEAAITHYNRLDDLPVASAWSRQMPEEVLSQIEGDGALAIAKLIDRKTVSAEDRSSVAMFAWMQHQRTPLGRAWQVFIQEQATRLGTMLSLTDVERTAASLRKYFEQRGQPATEEAIEAFRVRMLSELDDGSLTYKATHDHEVLGMFLHMDKGVELLVRQMRWVVLRATDAEFVIGDHPVAFYDETANPSEPVTWRSSSTVQVTLPLSPNCCLLLTPGAPVLTTMAADNTLVENINLRSYAWAHWGVYGSSANLLKNLHRTAQRRQNRVRFMAPRSPRLVIFDRIEGESSPRKAEILRPPDRGVRTRRRDS